MIAILYHAISNNNYKKGILKDVNVATISAENSERNENIRHIRGAYRVLAQDNYTHLHSQVANIVHWVSTVGCQGRWPPMPYYKYEP